MASQYEDTKAEIIRSITAQKNIYKFRQFLYSLNRDIRQTCFRITKEYLENEYHNNTRVTVTERERLLNIINYWQWTIFDNDATNWWAAVSFNHSRSLSLMTVINLWINDINTFDPETFETSTDGLR